MIERLKVGKSAHFYRKKKRLPKAAVVDLFRELRQASEAPSQNLFHHVKETLHGASWSAISFFYERDPSFLDGSRQAHKERICGYLLLIEQAGYVVLLKTNLDLPAPFKAEFQQRVEPDRVDRAVARAGVTFEQIRLRRMTTSKYALRNKTLEADNLEPYVGASDRDVARGYRVRQGSDHYTATPTTGLIAYRSEHVGHEEIVRWAQAVAVLLDDPRAQTSPLLAGLARPMELGAIGAGVTPTFIGFDVARLREELFDDAPTLRFVQDADGEFQAMAKADVDVVLGALDRDFEVRKVRGELRILRPNPDEHVGDLKLGKTRISLARLALPELAGVYTESTNPAEREGSRIPLKRHIDHDDLFTVLFSDMSLVYIEGWLYRVGALGDGGGKVLRHIIADGRLNAANSEKGAFGPAQREFSDQSVFRIIVDSVARGEEALVCDDLGDELADFIGVDSRSRPKAISFYHAKHGGLSLGATHMHIAISQALKNLGRLKVSLEEVAGKAEKWGASYPNSLIDRTARCEDGRLLPTFADAIRAPDTIRRVFIVTSSLSRAQLEAAFADIQAGQRPTPHFVQLYWLLTSFFASCADSGAYPYIVCQA